MRARLQVLGATNAQAVII
ncbi:protein of unknown function [Blastococcus saxobsidens DD2]|uniref:Uncharacterized protein n=1 Tax=Blastococcus saxobsidens (strain DD2) TaxID=1146883 RepID=H6RMC7_BLASD|nr:protein of unknown function [Blastococcus saxobsidens DD2]